MLDVISQIQLAYKRANRLAALLGFALGGFVPVAVYQVAHRADWRSPGAARWACAVLVLGGLLFSAVTVYQWGRLAFQSASKALGFLALAELTMIASPVPWLAQVALGYLLFVNGTATACNLVLARPAKVKRERPLHGRASSDLDRLAPDSVSRTPENVARFVPRGNRTS